MKNDNFLLSLSISCALHLALVYLFIFGLPAFNKYQFTEQIITFEMLDIADITNIPTQTKEIEQKEEIIKPEEAKKILNTITPEIKPLQEEPKLIEESKKPVEKSIEDPAPQEIPKVVATENINTPKKIEPKQEVKPQEKQKIEEPQKAQPKKLPEVKKLPEKTKPILKPEKKEDKKPMKKKQEDELESLLKTLEKSSKGTNTKATKTLAAQGNAQTTSKGGGNEAAKLSITEINLIKSKIQDAWQIPAGAQGVGDVRVILYISFERDGTIKDVKKQKIHCPTAEANICQVIADSAVRAALKASPIEGLRKERYDIWKEFNMEFNPNDILR